MSSEGSVRLKGSNMAKKSDMNEVIKTEEGDDPFMGDWNEQPFVLLLRVTI